MSSVHCVVVWEFQSGGQWVPHTPGVTRTLERAHAKKLTRVVLSDADPALKGHHVNLRTLTQCRDMPDGGSAECGVRRSCYSVQSVGGRGARWEWARLSSPPLPAELHYEPMPMEVQCVLEEAWCAGSECVSCGGWAVALGSGLARRGASVRVVRRAPQPPYPLTRTAPPAPRTPHAPHAPHTPRTPRTPRLPDNHHTVPARRAHIPQQHTGSSVHSVQSTLSAHSAHSAQSAQSSREARDHAPQARPGARSASPRDRKPNLARQILHNLNIFSNKQAAVPQTDTTHLTEAHLSEEATEPEPRADTECSSTRSTRRHSVDTVSTYLSHESKDSLQQGSVGELLNCSGGSDDVFESAPEPDDAPDDDVVDIRGLGVGVGACGWVRGVACPQWGAVCPVCMRALAGRGVGGGGGQRAVSLAPCQHMLHLDCLAEQLRAAAARASHTSEAIYIECLVCGRAYGADAGCGGARAPAPSPPVPLPAPPAPPAQPPGSMAWRLQHAALPQCDPDTAILVTYNFQSGVQSAGHPAPGAQYYAVGFPRHSLLPDDELGRQVLSLLRACWSRGVLFCVRASRTTGREHVVAWRARPPPAAPHHYLPPARPRQLLQQVMDALHALLDNDGTQC